MRASQYLLATLKETPADAEIISHQLMLRAGMIRKAASGLYSWLPLGLRVLKKVESIIRDEMNNTGALEILMPSVQPAELWQESCRWHAYGPELLRFQDRHEREFCYGPTHEEVITDIMRRELKSYKQLPINFYQIQTKFRDEIRPRFGIMRAREFLMKDAYSFHLDAQSLDETYQVMYQAYNNIFTRLGLDFRVVMADTGAIGGRASHEFQVLAQSGEDLIAYSDESDYAANVELAAALPPQIKRPEATAEMAKVATPYAKTIDSVSAMLKVKPENTIKLIVVEGTDDDLIALCLRGDHSLNPIKAEKLPQVASPLKMADEQAIQQKFHCKPGYLGPVNIDIPAIVDPEAAVLANFVCGANDDNYHLKNVNWGRDLAEPTLIADIRNVIEGDPSPDGMGHLRFVRGIEVGHIFQLGNKYSQSMNATVLAENGKAVTPEMGCYGIGVSRIVGAAIEQNHDVRGIIWPTTMAPFQIAIIPINYQKSDVVRNKADEIYRQLHAKGVEVLLDDRDERPGVKFADSDLIGIPHRIVISD